MSFKTNSYATIWEVDNSGRLPKVRISTSRKDQQTGTYMTDFADWVCLAGGAAEKVGSITEKARIKIGDCSVTNKYDKEKQKMYVNYWVYSFEFADTTVEKQEPKKAADIAVDDDGSEEDCPF